MARIAPRQGTRPTYGSSFFLGLFEEGTFIQFFERMAELFLGVHYYGAVPGDRFF